MILALFGLLQIFGVCCSWGEINNKCDVQDDLEQSNHVLYQQCNDCEFTVDGGGAETAEVRDAPRFTRSVSFFS